MQMSAVTALLLLGVLVHGTYSATMEQICENYEPLPCQRGWERLDRDRCMRIFWAQRNFDDAENYCDNFGGSLVSIHSETQKNRVACLVWRSNFRSKPRVWIGLRQKQSRAPFQYIDGTRLDYVNFYPGLRTSSSKLCVEANHKVWGRWGNTDCSETKHFVCAKKA